MNWLTLILQLYIVFLQSRNFITFKATNGANQKRILMFACALLMIGHILRHINNPPMYFLMMVTLIGVQLYDGYRQAWLMAKK